MSTDPKIRALLNPKLSVLYAYPLANSLAFTYFNDLLNYLNSLLKPF